MQETQKPWVRSLGWEDPLEKHEATPSSILAWTVPMDRGACRLPSTGSQAVIHDWSNLAHTHTFFWGLPCPRKSFKVKFLSIFSKKLCPATAVLPGCSLLWVPTAPTVWNIGLAEKFIWVFPEHVMEKSKCFSQHNINLHSFVLFFSNFMHVDFFSVTSRGQEWILHFLLEPQKVGIKLTASKWYSHSLFTETNF